MVTVEEISDDILDAVRARLDGMVVSKEDIVNDLLVIPEVASLVKTMRSEENRAESIPKWAKDAGVTLANWTEAQDYIRSIREIQAEAQAKLEEAREKYVSRCIELRAEAQRKRPVVHGDVGRIVEATFKTWEDVPIAKRARYTLESRGKSEDEASLLKNNLLSAYRGECVRRASDS